MATANEKYNELMRSQILPPQAHQHSISRTTSEAPHKALLHTTFARIGRAFFKICGMTNNVKALKKDHFNENAFKTKAEMASCLRKNLVLGNYFGIFVEDDLKVDIENTRHG